MALLLGALPSSAGTFKPAPREGVPDLYTVVLAEGIASTRRAPRPGLPSVAEVAQELGRHHGGRVEEVWEDALQGFVVRMPEARAKKLAEDPRVLAVEQDFRIPFSAPVGDCYRGTPAPDTRPLPSNTNSPQLLSCSDPDPQNDPSPTGPPLCVDNWGIDRIDQLTASRDSRYYFTNNGRNAGTTVHIYVMDTGIRRTHREFQDANGASRVVGGADARPNPVDDSLTADTGDCYGHGTHVAGIIGGRTYGVAKDAILHSVRIIGCPGQPTPDPFATTVARALNWISGHVQRPAVINWSGGNDLNAVGSTTIGTAVQGVLNQGIVLVQAAGNQSPDYDPARPGFLRDACDWSLGEKYPGVIVAGGMDEYDGRWTRRPSLDADDALYCPNPYSLSTIGDCGSNAGACVDIWAPASHVISANMSGDNLSCRLSGTSMAAPHVTGVVAVYLEDHPNATISEVERALRSRGTWNVLEAGTGDPSSIGPAADNVVVYSDTLSPGPDLPPTATYIKTCSGRTCSFDATGSADDFGISSYLWNFGDGSSGSGSVIQHVFPPGFKDRVTLTVTDGLNHADHFSTVVTAQVAAKDALVLAQSVPATMVAGRTYPVSVTLKNVGTEAWNPIGPQCNAYRLGSANPYSNGTWVPATRVELPAPVAPGGQVTLSFTVTAPSIPGTYNFQWQMVQECVQWFGDFTPNVVVTVQPPLPKDAQFLSQSVPATMAAGRIYSVSMTLKNVGTQTWSPIGSQCNAYRLGSANPYNNGTWVPLTRVELPAPVAPGGQVTLSFKVAAPLTPGTYNFQWQMVQECVQWFGDLSPNVAVIVQAAPPKDAQILSQSVPASMVAGQSYGVSIRVRNVGTQTWSPVGPQCNAYRLGSANPYNNGTWVPVTRVDLSAPVAPGGEVTLGFTVTAPTTPGTYNFQWQMVQECVAWFGDFTPNVAVTVSP
ncbi:MAG TPA: S8 family serine peptidase [Thermoanaerobaculia bacterium]